VCANSDASNVLGCVGKFRGFKSSRLCGKIQRLQKF